MSVMVLLGLQTGDCECHGLLGLQTGDCECHGSVRSTDRRL